MRYPAVAVLLLAAACSDEDAPGPDATCTVAENADGSSTVTCGDQSVVVNQPEASEPTTVIRTADESAGDACAFGGKRIEAGRDANGNGVLDDDERESTAFLCNTAPAQTPPRVLEGDFVVADFLAAVVLSQFDELHGNLLIEAYPRAQLPEMRLRRVEGNVGVHNNPALTDLGAFADLVVTGDFNTDSNAAMTSLGDGPWQVNGSIGISGALTSIEALSGTTNPEVLVINDALIDNLSGLRGLQTVDALVLNDLDNLPSLAGLRSDLVVTGELRLEGCEDLTTLTGLPILSATAELELNVCGGLTELTIDVTALRSLRLAENYFLTSLSLPALTSVSDDVVLLNQTALTTLSAPLLHTVGDDLSIEGGALTDLGLPALERAVDVTVTGIFTLPACDVYDLLDQLSPPATTANQTGLDEPCVPNPCAGACTRDCSVPSDYVCL